jgi:SHS2 domain-containing protein
MPFRFLEEIATADVAFEAWGETLEEVFISCSDALLRTMAANPGDVLRNHAITLQLEHEELDMLLFSFLQELIFLKDARRLFLHADAVLVEGREGLFRLEALVRGEQIDGARHHQLVDVKAVTLHRFRLQYLDNIWKSVVVLDV